MSKLIDYCTKVEQLCFFISNILTRKSSDQQTDDQPKAFLFVLALKTTNGLRTVNYLIAQTPDQIHLFDSIFILLRTLLSDAITHFYLLAKSVNSFDPDATLIEQIKILEADHINYLDKNLKVYQKLYNDTDENIGRMKSELRQKYPEYFKSDRGLKYHSNNIGGMAIDIVNSKVEFLISNVAPAYDLYDTFSKLEHLGALTLQLVTRHYYIEKHREIYKQMYFAVNTSLVSLNSLITQFTSADELKFYEKSVQEILDIKMYE
jgi:hypothetical protein